jgi:acylphosphatase
MTRTKPATETPGHLDIRIRGMVQGVGFRWSARAEAARLGVSGYVRNEADDSVFIEAEAAPAILDAYVAWCRVGPVSARVERVDIKPGPVRGYAGFGIRLS